MSRAHGGRGAARRGARVALGGLVLLCALRSAAAQGTPRPGDVGAPPPPEDPNVLVFVLDDVAYEDWVIVSAAGGTPHIDALAAAGRAYTRAFANPTCIPTRWSLQYGVFAGFGAPLPPPGALVGLAEIRLNRTAAFFGKWHLGGDPYGLLSWECAPMNQGWDLFEAGLEANVDAGGGSGYAAWMRADPGTCSSALSSDYQPQAVADAALAFVSAQPRGAPWIAVVNTQLAHSPRHDPPAHLLPPGYAQGPGGQGQHRAMLAAYDTLIGQVLAAVDRERTLVIVVGDNGTPAWAGPPQPTKAKGTVFERGIHVPLILAGPQVVPGPPSARLVHVADVHATVAQLWSSPVETDGISLVRPRGAQHEYVLCGDVGEVCARSANRKLRRVLATGAEQFYDLILDPFENQNRIAEPAYAAEVAAHRAWLDAHLP